MTTEKVLTNVDNFKHEPNPYVTYLKHNSGHDDAISYLGKHVNITYLFEISTKEHDDCCRLLSDGDVVEVRRGLEILKNSSIARGDGKIEYLKTVTFMNLHSNCRKNYTNDLSITAFKRRQEEPSTSVSTREKESVLLFSM
ncbi:hypothetical protein PV328_011048 [Microctonus aethiopoides]|uniref:Uncharacterized protein n=1 Tax=Microctonus aethiopoides TaxID=144406 RepID=A0AA39EXE1_9HYME|nr:hypothetical protein PV328_011048 [Microctonus aethiopoides]